VIPLGVPKLSAERGYVHASRELLLDVSVKEHGLSLPLVAIGTAAPEVARTESPVRSAERGRNRTAAK
jgi:hypothetical protein